MEKALVYSVWTQLSDVCLFLQINNILYRRIWCFIYLDKLVYFETDKKLTVCGEIEICDIFEVDQPKPLNENQSNQDYKLIFTLKTAKRTWTFRAQTIDEVTEWLRHIRTRALPDVIHYGFLHKRGENKKYHKYYFELNALKQLRFYEDKFKHKYIGYLQYLRILV